MDNVPNETSNVKSQPEPESASKHVVAAISTIAGCACATFILGALFNAAWPAAVAVCGLSAMGVGVAYFMLRRN